MGEDGSRFLVISCRLQMLPTIVARPGGRLLTGPATPVCLTSRFSRQWRLVPGKRAAAAD